MNSVDSSQPEPPGGQTVTATVERYGRASVVVVSGDIDMVTAPEFEKALIGALRDGPGQLVVDLTAVAFLGSAGLTALVAARQAAGDSTAVRVVAASSATARPLQLTGLDQEIPLFATRAEALAG